jgi:hypothetical protein
LINPLSDWRGLALIINADTTPKARDPKTYLLERFTPFTVLLRGKPKWKETASGGHSRHLKQEMQSCCRYSCGAFSGIAPTAHSFTHFRQWVQSSVTNRFNIRKREKIEKRVPRGHRYRHQNLFLTTPRARMATKKTKIKRLTLNRGRGIAETMKEFLGRKL